MIYNAGINLAGIVRIKQRYIGNMINSADHTIDWESIERGVPITNDNYFVRHDKETGLIYDDRGGFIHQNYCYVENRREITWIKHDLSLTCPCSARDIVLVESDDGELCLTDAYLVIWGNISRYRVIRQKISCDQPKATSSEIIKLSNMLKPKKGILTTFVILASALFI